MCLRFIDDVGDRLFWYARKKHKFNVLMESEPELREKHISFGLNVVIFCAITIPLCLVGIIIALISNPFGFGGVFKVVCGAISIFLGVIFAFEALLKIPLVRWQRKLNGNKIGVAAMVMDIILFVLCLALIVLNIFMMLSVI